MCRDNDTDQPGPEPMCPRDRWLAKEFEETVGRDRAERLARGER